MTRKTLTRNQILKAKDIREEWVPVPEWAEGAELLVITWSASTRDQFDNIIERMKKGGKIESRALMVALAVVDPKTKLPIFSEDDIKDLAKKNQTTMDRLFQAAYRLNPIQEVDENKAVEEKAKNS